ncbi:nucleoside diphosphate kinase regulator [Bermanella marisrubri]|uniref:Putative regulator of nucleoside diphosphate kinase n=1 Tax=Bermanella marisrubri TaxID=207949 RepID=Q1N6D3_9GAMM|nr:nucleoside diphosphate kinase regulator [Bermanella marisrubri]EAT13659.1 putative regulator of nucleoside diphosphate kinase [Oceanobacter sp. RED65] [Bermanella marisrubri]
MKPELIISKLDADRLYRLLETLPKGHVMGGSELEDELDRANLVEPTEIPPNIVSMNSKVKFEVVSTNQEFELTLVYPKDLDQEGKTISILAPVGSALLGLSIGDSIEWSSPGGGILEVIIKDIVYQPERAGELHR